jgi:nucleotide-binding universal stress UspA family protein
MKVLLATDGSKCSAAAAAILARLPHRDQLQVTIATAIAPPSVAFFSPTKQFMEQLAEDDRKYAETHQAKTQEIFTGANASVETIVLEGTPQEVIVDYAKSHDIELIVLGAKGHSQVDRILLGSTSDYVATHAHCSVLVVRQNESEPEESRKLRVAVAYDASAAARYAVDELLQFDWGANTELFVVGVAGYSPIFDPEYGFNPKSIRNEAQDALREASQRLQPRVNHVESRLIEYDHVAEGLVRFTEDEQIDLIVIGDTGRSTLARALLGSVSRFVLRHAKCGVWITRNRNRNESQQNTTDQTDKVAGAT